MKKINIDEIMHETFSAGSLFAMKSVYTRDDNSKSLYEKWQVVIKEAIRQALELAADNATTTTVKINYTGARAGGYYTMEAVDPQSIIDIINQVE